ncbi:hypothetical protein [Nonomuraea sp. NPDC050310]|uniref:hypothetical protein n=1 Tax=Nonomuraea sp. NPDC050310 TaxID=3154935 RepID=UPI0033FD82E8
MDDLETRLGEVLAGPGEARPPAGLAGRVHAGVVTRRRRRRAVAAGACVLALAVAIPLTVRQASDPGRTTVAASAGGIADLVDLPGSIALPPRTPEGTTFFPEVIGEDGSVLGRTDQDKKVWAAGPHTQELQPVTDAAAQVLGTGEGGLRLWAGASSAYPLSCQDASGATSDPSPQGYDPAGPFWVSHGWVAANDPMRQPWTAKGCAKGTTVSGQGRFSSGHAVAFAYPDLFVAEESNDRVVRQVDVESGREVAERPLPEGVPPVTMADPGKDWLAAANGSTFAWVVDRTLRTAPRDTWTPTTVPVKLPTATPVTVQQTTVPQAKLTMGDRLIAYTALELEVGWKSVVHDPVTGRSVELPGRAYAAGEWLVWQDGDSYRLARALTQ